MLANTLSLTIGGDTVTMTKVDQSNYSSTYLGDDAGNAVKLTVKHDLKAKSHLVRVDYQVNDSEGLLVREMSAWTVLRTGVATQDTATLIEVGASLAGLLTASTNAVLTSVAGYES
jgi:hypothetical protein